MRNGSGWFRWWVLVVVLTGTAAALRADAPEKRPTGDKSGHQAGEIAVNPINGAEMVWVPAGEFPMGSETEEAGEKPAHRVRLTKGFWLYKTPVTNAQYDKFLVENPQTPEPPFAERLRGKPQQSAFGVRWQDARDYCRWAKAVLPTEAQWEYAARGPQGKPYPWGEGKSWCGAARLAGDVWQWCADWYSEDYYSHSPLLDPLGSAGGRARVVRGGARHNGRFDRFESYRRAESPRSGGDMNGFRPARTAESQRADVPAKQPATIGKPPNAPGSQVGEIKVNPIDGAEMVWVPAGEFPMGSEKGQPASAAYGPRDHRGTEATSLGLGMVRRVPSR